MKLCNNLNYTRSLSPGKAVFYYESKDGQMNPIKCEQTHLRAPKAGFSEAFNSDYSTKNTAPQDLSFSNPQFIEECYVPVGIDEIKIRFSLRIEANSLQPDKCSDIQIREILQAFATKYKENGGYQELGERYAKNLLSGTWLWRNEHNLGTSISIKTTSNQEFNIDNAFKLSRKASAKDKKTISKLGSEIANALSDPDHYWFADITATINVAFCQEIYPSQEFLDTKEKGKPSKVYAKTSLLTGEKTVALHAQKIGAAIQLIDDWWDEDADIPLRVNEFGADHHNIIARRHPSHRNDFYTLIQNADNYSAQLDENSNITDDMHYVMAVLVKGGLFQKSASSKKGK
ncbi:type I-F CRISPR-associated protein Csy3 [Aliivibrio fischeri]|uniref:type I-F CRISPR-associated protein Csy3 n=1 Tax=Aliivibrio fischeri TaxID=668 RepID=UPI0012DA8C33|nr:type I-F CRISPR-associated protein Csy3 [Aliivibrio fischeri]MUJ22975.1 type I-F CRISPR-associated protein Csy3 [Aliivibrio fischeri]